MRYSHRIQHVLVVASVAGAVGFYKVATTPDRDWVRVARDANYDVALDRGSVKPVEVAWFGRWFKAFDVSYRTDHAQPRLHKGKTFDREIVRAIVQCDSMFYKVRSVDMSVGAGRPVARQQAEEADLRRQEWRRVEPATTEEIAALAACHFGKQAANRVAETTKRP